MSPESKKAYLAWQQAKKAGRSPEVLRTLADRAQQALLREKSPVRTGALDPLGWAEDVINAAKKGIGDIVDAVGTLPGGNLVRDALLQGQEWAVDLAKNQPWVLSALAMGFYGPLAQALGGIAFFGPQLASVLWAFPGVVRGESFTKAWTKEFIDRCIKLAEYFGGEAGKKFASEAGPAAEALLEKAKKAFPNLPIEQALHDLDVTPESLAAELGIRTDLAAIIIGYAKGYIPSLDDYDLKSGRPAVQVYMESMGYVSPTRAPLATKVASAPGAYIPLSSLTQMANAPGANVPLSKLTAVAPGYKAPTPVAAPVAAPVPTYSSLPPGSSPRAPAYAPTATARPLDIYSTSPSSETAAPSKGSSTMLILGGLALFGIAGYWLTRKSGILPFRL